MEDELAELLPTSVSVIVMQYVSRGPCNNSRMTYSPRHNVIWPCQVTTNPTVRYFDTLAARVDLYVGDVLTAVHGDGFRCLSTLLRATHDSCRVRFADRAVRWVPRASCELVSWLELKLRLCLSLVVMKNATSFCSGATCVGTPCWHTYVGGRCRPPTDQEREDDFDDPGGDGTLAVMDPGGDGTLAVMDTESLGLLSDFLLRFPLLPTFVPLRLYSLSPVVTVVSTEPS